MEWLGTHKQRLTTSVHRVFHQFCKLSSGQPNAAPIFGIQEIFLGRLQNLRSGANIHNATDNDNAPAISGHSTWIEPKRDAEGRVDVEGTMQVIMTVLEGWVREHPEQWLWPHRLWR